MGCIRRKPRASYNVHFWLFSPAVWFVSVAEWSPSRVFGEDTFAGIGPWSSLRLRPRPRAWVSHAFSPFHQTLDLAFTASFPRPLQWLPSPPHDQWVDLFWSDKLRLPSIYFFFFCHFFPFSVVKNENFLKRHLSWTLILSSHFSLLAHQVRPWLLFILENESKKMH